MLFSWLIKNKHFKKGSDIKAQVTPLLIVVMVILLIAALATINVGRVALDKTYSSNGTDAGALAAASNYDAAFNELASDLKPQLFMQYITSYAAYDVLYNKACDNITTAIVEAMSGDTLYNAAFLAYKAFDPGISTQIDYMALPTVAATAAAAALLFEARMQVDEFYFCAQYMKSILDDFHTSQWAYYVDIRNFMDDARQSSVELGYSYAFANSGISEKLSSTQSSAFSSWLSGKQSGSSASYTWKDTLNLTHNVNVILTVPWIRGYDLQTTRKNFPYIEDKLDTLIQQAPLIEAAFTAVFSTIATFGALLVIVFALSIVANILSLDSFTMAAAMIVAGIESAIRIAACLGVAVVVAALAALLTIAGSVSLYLLQSDNDDAYNGWFTDEMGDAPGHTFLNSRSAGGGAFNDSIAKDLMIVMIYDVEMDSWDVTATEHQIHPKTITGIMPTNYPPVSSSTRVDFSGGGSSADKIWRSNGTFDCKIIGAG